MADIEVKCTVCEKTIRISEFADVDTITCRSCGGKLKKPEKLTFKPKATIRATRAEDEQAADDTPPTEWRFHKTVSESKKKTQENVRKGVSHHVLSWMLFVLLAAGMGYARYGGALQEAHFKLLQEKGIYLFLGLYLMVVLLAYKDSIFQGILCTLIPGYALFYLFFISDDFYMRAIVAGAMVGVGQDSGLIIKEWSIEVYNLVSKFIATQGET